MFTNLQKQFAVNDVRACPCPWNEDIVFYIIRDGARVIRDFEEKNQAENPALRKFSQVLLKEQITAQSAGRNNVSQSELIRRAAEKCDLSDVELDMFVGQAAMGAAVRIERWEGLQDAETGEPVEATEENILELLRADQPVAGMVFPPDAVGWTPDDEPDAEPEYDDDTVVIADGTAMGSAIAAWVVWESGRSETYRENWTEDAAKN
jgi:hypothetical protein